MIIFIYLEIESKVYRMKLPPITHIVARRPADTLADGYTNRTYLGTPDLQKTYAQYDAYIAALRSQGLDVTVLGPAPNFPDAHYVEDPAVIFDNVAFITQPGAPNRRDETQEMASQLAVMLAEHELVFAEGDAKIDGGDVLFTADRVLIGLSKRTNLAGAQQLKVAITNWRADAKVDFVPLDGVLHLKTGMTELVPGILLQDPHMTTDYKPDFAEVIVLPEAEGYAANVLPIVTPDKQFVIISKGFPTVLELAQQHYDTVIELDMSEFEKMDGSLTCLSLRIS